MADLCEQQTFTSLEQQFHHWYYFTKISAINDLIAPHLSSNRGPFLCLDIGAGNGIISYGLSKLNPYYDLKWNRIDINYSNDDLLRDPLKARTIPRNAVYDIIVACDVLEHLRSPTDLVQELRDHCHSKTILAITVPAHQYLWSYHDVALRHFKRYTTQELISDLTPCFYVISTSYLYRLLLPVLFIYRKLNMILSPKPENRTSSDMQPLPYLLNAILTWLLQCEGFITRAFTFSAQPQGSSILVIAKPCQTLR